MALDSFTDVLRALEDHPEWREQMRTLVPTRVVEQMALQVQRNGDDTGELKGDMRELRVPDQASAFFGSRERRAT